MSGVYTKVVSKHESTMRIIIQKSDGNVYVYRESEESFKNNEPNRIDDGLQRIQFTTFDNDCDTKYMPDNSYCVVLSSE